MKNTETHTEISLKWRAPCRRYSQIMFRICGASAIHCGIVNDLGTLMPPKLLKSQLIIEQKATKVTGNAPYHEDDRRFDIP